jgi:hypothetical protein
MMKLNSNKLTLTFIGLLTVSCTLCLAKAQAPRVRSGGTSGRIPRQRPTTITKVQVQPVTVANIGDYTITNQELEQRMMMEIRPRSYENYNEVSEPFDVKAVLLKMIAEKAMITEARKEGYLKDESLSSLIQRERDKRLVNLLLTRTLQPKLDKFVITQAEIQKRMKANPKLNKARAESMAKRAKAQMLFSRYFSQIYKKFNAKKVTENFPLVVQIHQRLLTQPKTPRKGNFIRISQTKEEITPEEKNIVLVSFDKGKITLKDWFATLCEMAPPSRPKDLNTEKGVERLLDRALARPILLAEALQQRLDKDKALLQAMKKYEDDRLLSKVTSAKYKEVKQPTSEEIMIYFGKNREIFRKDKKLKIDTIWCRDLKTARQAKAELDKSEDFEAVKQKYCLQKTTKPFDTYPGGEGLFWNDLWKGDPNDIIGPMKGFYRSGISWRIVKILEKNPGKLTGYSPDMDNRIKGKMISEQREAILERYRNELLKEYTYQIYIDKIKSIDPLNIP